MANALFPKSIEVDNASIQQLELLFTVATKDLSNYIFTLNGKVITKAQIMMLRQECHQRIQKLGNDVGTWISTAIPLAYAQGQHDAARQQSHFGDKAAAAAILAVIVHEHYANKAITGVKVVTPPAGHLDLQNQGVKAIMDDMSSSFGESLTVMSRSVDGVISKVQSLHLRRLIAEQADKGATADAISKQITAILEDNNIYSLVDRAGKHWQPDVYAKMLTRTKLVEARNNGMMNALIGVGHDLVQVSAHGAIDQCGPWESRILSISGNNKLFPSVEDAYSGGLFHPNCKHSLNAVNPAFYPSSKPEPITV